MTYRAFPLPAPGRITTASQRSTVAPSCQCSTTRSLQSCKLFAMAYGVGEDWSEVRHLKIAVLTSESGGFTLSQPQWIVMGKGGQNWKIDIPSNIVETTAHQLLHFRKHTDLLPGIVKGLECQSSHKSIANYQRHQGLVKPTVCCSKCRQVAAPGNLNPWRKLILLAESKPQTPRPNWKT